nr:exo-alpha-sialidase [Rubripirellula tenax]
MICLSSILVADDATWKLRPLAYNHPGLEVDLGVGLWAYPIPIDYDQDGDMDLLVACPDKPTNGVHYFENLSQDPKLAMPVFKAPVRLGDAAHYMLMSKIGDESVILKPGNEYRRDPETGEFDFAKPRKIDAVSNPNHESNGRTRANMWRYVDYDNDGDHDIVVGSGDWTELGWDHAYDSSGTWRNGPLHGYVYVMRNEGTDQSPKYSDTPFRVQAAGGDVDVYGWPCPNFADFDNDGDLDLLCGEFMDGFTYFRNIGTATDPIYAAGQKLNAADGRPLVMHLQMITPTAIDWDTDGDLDLIVGDEDGRVALVENTGRFQDGAPEFAPPKYFRQEADTLKFGALATPFAYDWDNDGDEDILCGNTAGSIGLFENLGAGAGGLPKWTAPKRLNVKAADGSSQPFRVMAGDNGSIQGPCEAKWGYTTLSVADWDADGDGDIVFNSILSRIGLLMNEGGTLVEQEFDTGLNESPPAWYWWQTKSGSALTQWRTTPVAIDFDGDGGLDLVMLDQQGYLTLRSSGGPARRIFVDEDNQPLRLNAGTCGRSGRVKLAVADWDGDSRLDVFVNSENAIWYRNCEDRDGKIVLKKIGNLADRNVAGHTSSPAICDFDRDGKPDLLVGSENGRIYHLHHKDAIKYSAGQIESRPAIAAPPGRFQGFVSEDFIFTKADFKQCHASTICQTTRGLVTAWFGGTKEGDDDVRIWTSYHDGLQWSKPIAIADGIQHDGLRYPCWNPVLFQPPGDGPTMLFFKVGPSPKAWWGEVMVSYDRGRTFVDRRRLPEGIVGPVRCKPILIDGGRRLLCGSSTEDEGWRVHFESVGIVDGEINDRWKRIGPIDGNESFRAIQPTFLTHADGRLQVLCRTQEDVIATSESADIGKTWTKLVATRLPNPNSGIDAVSLSDGRHLLVYNPLTSGITGWGKRSSLALAISNDGHKWSEVGLIEKDKASEFSYPAVVQTSDGLVHVTYTHRRTEIKHVVIDPSQISDPPIVADR